ncbi:hypothetical protein CP981_34320 [Streptomyces platensis]|uniref:Uncharacterized protein n=1 Tax=Streptomyces platensis TaxID=58346 RepID=A0AAE6NN03_STRPT|nr:DUF5825 family protein [Streptomyces platensis]OSY48365.1 hypothetical protein BG653_00242 [Streptomyces platensis]QEV56009.1 hypothetical protein CP981_34320 [Streptomyces platensis]
MTSTATPPTRALTLHAWRDYDKDACALPGMSLGAVDLTAPPDDQAARLWELGARRVEFTGEIDLTAVDDPADADRAVRSLCLIRDLTARAVLVQWQLRLPPEPDDGWRDLSHLQPPRTLTGPTDPAAALAEWRNGHYLCKCLWRQGPGFVQIRDRRWGELRRFTAEEPEYQQAIDRLSYGAPLRDVPPAIAADFLAERLVSRTGPLLWWLPYRVNRWIQEAMAV